MKVILRVLITILALTVAGSAMAHGRGNGGGYYGGHRGGGNGLGYFLGGAITGVIVDRALRNDYYYPPQYNQVVVNPPPLYNQVVVNPASIPNTVYIQAPPTVVYAPAPIQSAPTVVEYGPVTQPIYRVYSCEDAARYHIVPDRYTTIKRCEAPQVAVAPSADAGHEARLIQLQRGYTPPGCASFQPGSREQEACFTGFLNGR